MKEMESVLDNTSLSKEEQARRLKKAKMGTWYNGWRPYCVHCSFNGRMTPKEYGFECPSCGNMIGFNLNRLKESPLNK